MHEGFTDRSEKHEHHDDHEKHGYHAARLGMLALNGLAHDGLSAGVILNRQQWILLQVAEAFDTIRQCRFDVEDLCGEHDELL